MIYFLILILMNAAMVSQFPRFVRQFLVPVCAALLVGCSMNRVVEWVDPYRIDIRQGNYVDQDMVAQLRPGMTRDQVRFVLGTPLIEDTFRKDRWDYVYVHAPGGRNPRQSTLSVFFRDDLLERVSGDLVTGEPTTGMGGDSGAGDAEQGTSRNRVVEVPAPADKK